MKNTILHHNQIIRVKGLSPLANKITVRTSKGYHAESNYSEEQIKELEEIAQKNGHERVWSQQECSVIESDYPGKDEAIEAKEKAIAEAVEIEDGQTVEIEGEPYIVRVSDQGHRVSDPVAFIPVK